jgi:hypothetical protein
VINGTAELNFEKRKIHVWVFDFYQCDDITSDEAGCQKAALAHWQNDPYYPRPHGDSPNDQALWKAFVEEYTRVGKLILKG